MCFVFIWEPTATCATYSVNWLVFITQIISVYSAGLYVPSPKKVWTRSLCTLNRQCFPKPRHIKFRSQGIAQKAEYKIGNLFPDVSFEPIGLNFKGQKNGDRHVFPHIIPEEGIVHLRRGRNVKHSSYHLDAASCYVLFSGLGIRTDRYST